MTGTTNKIKKIGNGHFIPLPASLMKDANLHVGQEITIATDQTGAITVRAVDGQYAKTRASAGKMVERYRRALVKLGREGDGA